MRVTFLVLFLFPASALVTANLGDFQDTAKISEFAGESVCRKGCVVT
jgi:hypothetical protein